MLKKGSYKQMIESATNPNFFSKPSFFPAPDYSATAKDGIFFLKIRRNGPFLGGAYQGLPPDLKVTITRSSSKQPGKESTLPPIFLLELKFSADKNKKAEIDKEFRKIITDILDVNGLTPSEANKVYAEYGKFLQANDPANYKSKQYLSQEMGRSGPGNMAF